MGLKSAYSWGSVNSWGMYNVIATLREYSFTIVRRKHIEILSTYTIRIYFCTHGFDCNHDYYSMFTKTID